MNRSILCVDAASKPALTYNAFYVGISRVEAANNLRVMRLHADGDDDWRARLKSLMPSVLVVKYMLQKTSYNATHTYLKAMYKQKGFNYDKRGSDKRIGIPAGRSSQNSMPCRWGCGRKFGRKNALIAHESS